MRIVKIMWNASEDLASALLIIFSTLVHRHILNERPDRQVLDLGTCRDIISRGIYN